LRIEQLVKNKHRIPTTPEFTTTRIAQTKNIPDAALTQNNINFTTVAKTKKLADCGTFLRLTPLTKNILKGKYSHCPVRKPNFPQILAFYRAL
jgi:hypothetical protein